MQFLQSLNTLLGGKGGAAMRFEKENGAFFENTHNSVSQGILSTIVATACMVINAVEQLSVD